MQSSTSQPRWPAWKMFPMHGDHLRHQVIPKRASQGCSQHIISLVHHDAFTLALHNAYAHRLPK
jgi:hypothetical protein